MPTFNTGTVSLAYDDTGGDKPPLLLLHGLTARRQHLAHFIPPLVGEWRVLSVDLRGHAESGHVDGRYQFADYADDIAALLQGVLNEPAVVVGHSLGAITAFMTAAKAPDRVRAIALLDPPLYIHDSTLQEKPNASVWFGWVHAQLKIDSDAARISAALPELDPAATPEWAAEVGRNLSRLDIGTVAAALENSAAEPHDLADALNAVRCPALLIRGEWDHDALLDDEDAAWAKAHVPQLVDVVIPQGTHLFPFERPDETIRHLVAFLETVRAGGGDTR